MKHEVAVLDFGSQYTQLIVRRVRELGYFARLFLPEDAAALGEPGAIILSGGPKSVRDPGAPDTDIPALEGYGVPILGICYGMQLLNRFHGGVIEASDTREYGPARLRPEHQHQLYAGVRADSGIWMSHSDTCTQLPPGAQVIARNEEDVPIAIEFKQGICGIQFHPEVTHSEEGRRILGNFLESAPQLAEFSIADFAEHLTEQVREQVGEREVVCGVSGGVDSSVVAVLLHKAGVKVRNIFVDNGLMRLDEADEVMARFEAMGVPVEKVDASERFLDALAGQDDPETKRKIIGRLFVEVFWDAVGSVDDSMMLAQGTLYPDVIESASNRNSQASVIKTHHNRVDKVLELQEAGRVIEPLDELFKDEVRALGQVLGIPQDALWRHPFPGPGLAVRVPGEVTRDKLEMVRQADDIFISELRSSGWYDKTWQAYAGILPIRTVGVKGDERAYEYPIVLRAVMSDDAMTADWVALPEELLRRVSNKILNRVSGVNRVFYDISTKPPASIELE